MELLHALSRICRSWPATIAVLLCAFLEVQFAGAAEDPPAAKRFASDLKPTTQTVALFRVGPGSGDFKDVTGRFAPVITGAKVVPDDQWGGVLRFDETQPGDISIKDDGKLSFDGGLTIDAWVCLEGPPPKGAAILALKAGSFAWDLRNGKLNTTWLTFPADQVFTTAPAQFKTFPVGGDTINGFMNVPTNKWVRLTMAYDQALGAVITRIDGMTDRSRYRYRGPERLQCDGRSPITFLQGFKNCRVAAIRMDVGRPRLATPTLEAYVNALPYRDQVMVTFDHMDPDLPLPIEATVVWEKPSGEAATARTITLKSRDKTDVMLDLPTWKDSLHTLTVNAAAADRAIFTRAFRVASVRPAGPIQIGEDRTLSRDGRPFFPLMVYHAMPDDFPMLAELGFNVIYNDFSLSQRAPKDRDAYAGLLTQTLDAAAKNNLLVWASTNTHFNKLHTIPVAKAHPALLGWYGADEPWGDLTRLIDSYNTIKMLEPNRPVLIVQNNYSRLQETAQGADIIATDPYPVPNVSLRAVADATHAATSAVSGRKPVWTILAQYDIPKHQPKIPTRDELRCMAWLAIIHGANGLGIFSWDDRTIDPGTKALSGWYTKDRPEQVETLRAVLKELRSLEQVLLAPAGPDQPAIAPANSAIHAAIRVDGAAGKRYLMIANDSRRAESGTLRLPGVADGAARCLTAEGKPANLKVVGSEVHLHMPPLGVAVYELVGPTVK